MERVLVLRIGSIKKIVSLDSMRFLSSPSKKTASLDPEFTQNRTKLNTSLS
jgi:hypothetical protein